jgi:hypothetical protein
MRLTVTLYGYTVIAIAQTMPILVVAFGDASTDRDARRKSPLTGAFFCLKIESEYCEPTQCAIKDAEQEAKDIAPSSHRLGTGRHLIRKWLSYETLE